MILLERRKKIIVELNIVYDTQYYKNEEEAKKAAAAQLEDLRKVYGRLDIEFNVTYTPGSATNLYNLDATLIDPKSYVPGAINVFISRAPGMVSAWSRVGKGTVFLNMANLESWQYWPGGTSLSHEVAHHFGLIMGGGLIGNIRSDVDLEIANANLRFGGRAIEGLDWVDDYRNATESEQTGRFGSKIVPRRPTIYDTYRAGARKFQRKR